MATNGRLRDYLTKREVRALLRAAKQSKRYAARNYAMILLAYRHGFRASELLELRVGDVDLRAGTIYCRRQKGSKSSVHPMKRDEIEAIERVLRDRESAAPITSSVPSAEQDSRGTASGGSSRKPGGAQD